MKILLIGEKGIGKTTTIHQYIIKNLIRYNNKWNVFEFKKGNINKWKNTLLDIWDTLSQDKYFIIAQISIQKPDLVNLLCDLTVKNIFLNLNNINFPNYRFKWYIIIGISANKYALNEQELINSNEIEENGKENKWIFFTSAKIYDIIS